MLEETRKRVSKMLDDYEFLYDARDRVETVMDGIEDAIVLELVDVSSDELRELLAECDEDSPSAGVFRAELGVRERKAAGGPCDGCKA